MGFVNAQKNCFYDLGGDFLNILGFIYLGIYNLILNSLVNTYTTDVSIESFGTVGFENFTDFTGKIAIVDEIYNIFAWIDVFINVDLCFSLFLLTSLFYGLKFSISLAKKVLSLIK